ncbi:hypothetical protein BKA62DRAFT_57402 [Auriculariales sp. MPI-PUGE-AT-0066]|nr:hypothetical protein BKA62DRAFT_57402 [Auriculariales sp. MPI-PUGE-AT-0066]
MASVLRPLKGNVDGKFKILIVGNCGTGKTTLQARLSNLLKIPGASMDQFRWLPNWEAAPKDVFRARIETYMSTNLSWILDGNSSSVVFNLAHAEATDVIWLDPPFLLYYPRLLLRTFTRILRFHPAGSLPDGCYETIRNVFFDSESVLWWGFLGHWKRRGQYEPFLRTESVELGGKWRRIGGWGSELRRWLCAIEYMVTPSTTARNS